MNEKNLIEFLKVHKESLIDEIKNEFYKELEARKFYKGFKKIMFDDRLVKKIKLTLVDKAGTLDAETRLCIIDSEDVKPALEDLIKECMNG